MVISHIHSTNSPQIGHLIFNSFKNNATRSSPLSPLCMIYIIANCSIYLTTFTWGYYVVELVVVAGKTFRLCLQSHKTQLLQLLQLVIGVQWLLLLHLQLFDAHAHTQPIHTQSFTTHSQSHSLSVNLTIWYWQHVSNCTLYCCSC